MWRLIVRQWQEKKISNFHYLLCLNSMADRSFHDITQYPVFPWIVADYTSETLDFTRPSTFRDLTKPVGALNPDRLAMFKARFREMSGDDPKFLYGSHYSTPAYTLFYLLRSAPALTLQLHDGKFDPARAFHSVEATWRTVNTNPADVKELVPEFYQPPGDFLVKPTELDLGIRADGTTRVGDVELPPWATDAADFTRQCRRALESDYVSDNIHHWIDLVFGVNQRGENAIACDNLFHPFTYEGGIDVDDVTDPRERRAILSQIGEFGQTPRQVFTSPHPARHARDRVPGELTIAESTPLPAVSPGETPREEGDRL